MNIFYFLIFIKNLDNTLTPGNVKTFLYYYFLTVKEKSDKKWESYGITICDTDEEICPWDLLTIKRNESLTESAGSSSVTEKDDPWMALYCLSIYRSIRATINEYRAQITDRINSQLKSIMPTASEMTEATTVYLGWANDHQYNMMVAAIDMFFNRFPTHKYANMLIGTTGSRYKDCAGLLSYGYMMHLLGMDEMIELMDWVFVNAIGDDIDRMMKTGEELTDHYSYFPYQVDMRLVIKSNYSAITNPQFFEFVHLIGTILRSPRSMNARHINENQIMNILMNASCVAYVYAHTFSLTKVYTSDGTFKESDEDENEESNNLANIQQSMYKSRDPNDWIAILKATDNQMPEIVRKYIKDIAKSIKDPREGTMDQYLANIASAL